MNQYFYLDSARQQQGPVDGAQLPSYGVNAETLVWCNGMADWTPAGQVPELAAILTPNPTYTAPNPGYAAPNPGYGQPNPGYNASPGYQQPATPNPAPGAYGQGAPQPNPYGAAGQPPCPDNNLVWAILTTLFCCLPFGIVAIVYSSKVNSLYATGQYAMAVDASEKAKKWSIWSAASAIAIWVIYALVLLIIAAAS